MAYEKTEWIARQGSNLNRFEKDQETNRSVVLQNVPNAVTVKGTKFSPANMNKIEQGIYDAHEMIGSEAQARKQAVQGINAIINDLIGLPAWNSNSHILTFTARDGSTLAVDLPLESLAKNIGYDPGTKEIVITKQNNSQIRVSVADLVDVYTGSLCAHIQVTIGANNTIQAHLRAGSITETELAEALLNTLVRTSGDQTVAGVKTFASIPVLPPADPTIGDQATRKAYVDEADNALSDRINALAPEGFGDILTLVNQKAPIASPTFTGTPKVPSKTAAATNGGTLIATEAQVYLKANVASPTFTGTPKVPNKTTAAASDGTLIATEAQVALKADLASPGLTGTPTAPTAPAKINSTQIATTAYADRAAHPVGSYYTQYPAAGQSTIANMFPESKSPGTLFGGTWTERFVGEEVFFKTAPSTAEANRGKKYNASTQQWSGTGTTGIQEDAARNITGKLYRWFDHYDSGWDSSPRTGAIEVANAENLYSTSNTKNMDNPSNLYMEFNASWIVPVDTTNHPKNRLIKVWEKTAN